MPNTGGLFSHLASLALNEAGSLAHIGMWCAYGGGQQGRFDYMLYCLQLTAFSRSVILNFFFFFAEGHFYKISTDPGQRNYFKLTCTRHKKCTCILLVMHDKKSFIYLRNISGIPWAVSTDPCLRTAVITIYRLWIWAQVVPFYSWNILGNPFLYQVLCRM